MEEILEMSTEQNREPVLLPTMKQLKRIDELIQHPALPALYIQDLSEQWETWITSRKKAGVLVNILKKKISQEQSK
jgi:hypothetical protein